MSALGSVREDIYKSIKIKEEVVRNDNYKFCLYVRIAESARKEYSFSREVEYMREAVSIRPNDLVANYRFGNSLERIGDGPGAVRAYYATLTDSAVVGKELKELILAQIRRIETLGPAKKPPIFGFSYASW